MNLWINRNFFLLWSGQFISQLGDKFYWLAIAWWIVEQTSSPSLMGLYLLASMAPEFIFAPAAGSFIDRWNKKAIIILTDLFRGLVIIGMSVIAFLGYLEIWHLFVVSISISLAAALYNPAVLAVIPLVVNKRDLSSANSLSQLVTGITTIVGPILGGVTVSILGFSLVFLINGFSYLFSAFFELFIYIAAKRSPEIKEKLMESVKTGLRYIARNRQVLMILIMIGVIHLFFGNIIVILPFLAAGFEGDGARYLGILEAMIGLGMVAGSILIALKGLKVNSNRVLNRAVILMGSGFLGLGMLNTSGIKEISFYAVFVLGIGLAASIASVSYRSVLQYLVPEELTGRVFSIAITIANISLPVSVGFFGIVLESYPTGSILLGTGLLLIFVVILMQRLATEKGAETVDGTIIKIDS